MSAPFHEGELTVQRLAGVERAAAAVGGSIHRRMPPPARAFARQQPLAILGAMGAGGRVWASALTGEPGFLAPEREDLLAIHASIPAGDPLAGALTSGSALGLLVIDFATRRRMRLNGRVADIGASIRVVPEQVYSNCPKHIRPRTVTALNAPVLRAVRRGQALSPDQRAWIARADTLFIASAHPVAGVDVSHRGGPPGFVRVTGDRTLEWDDFAGNALFQTLGNIAVEPRAGLLLVDFAEGNTLQITGRAETLWRGTERSVRFVAEDMVETSQAMPVRWRVSP